MSEHRPGRCLDLAERISEYIDGELPGGLRREIADHLHGCSTCERFVDSVRRVKELAHLLPAPSLPTARLDELATRVRDRLGKSE